MVRALRIRVKIPTSVVVDVVDAKPCRHGLIDFPNYARISREKLAHTLISETVCIRVVERAVLDAAVARGERGCAPLCNVWLPFSERVAGCDDEARVLFDDRVCVGEARIEIEAARHHVVAAIEKAKSTEGSAIAAAMKNACFKVKDNPGILLDVCFDDKGDIDRESFLVEVKDGKQVVTATLPMLVKR